MNSVSDIDEKEKRPRKWIKQITLATSVIVLLGFVVPERIKIPVTGATKSDWNQDSFWHEPWGTSGVHKGIDIFGKIGTDVTSTVDSLVVYTGQIQKGGKVVIVLGPRWRFHYYVHLDSISASIFYFVQSGQVIGKLGDSGNAKGTPPHLHYSIIRLLPAPWAIDRSTQGYKKAFFIDPSNYLIDK